VLPRGEGLTIQTFAEEHTDRVDWADREDLRLCLVMTGGVSLAIWMGGATREVNRLQRREESYAELLDLTGADLVVDVISGSSAGGINGALLALATARNNSVAPLRDLWLDNADMAMLFRSPLERDPPSLMKGDQLFLKTLTAAFRQLDQSISSPVDVASHDVDRESSPLGADHPLDLIITGSLLQGRNVPFVDDFGTVMYDLDHKARFVFRRGSIKHHLSGLPDKRGNVQGHPCTHREALHKRDDFADPHIHLQLALASRCTASFPIAFEPSLCPVGESTVKTPRPDMRCHASFNDTSYVVDGGVLVNKPLKPAIEAIYETTAERQVRRVLAYVVPDPGVAPVTTPEAEEDVLPTIVKTVIDSLITLPRNESIARELLELSEGNRLARAIRQARMAWLQAGGLVKRARDLYDEYVDIRSELSVEAILTSLEQGAAIEVGPLSDLTGWDRSKLRSALLVERKKVLPAKFPTEAWRPDQDAWRWGLKPVEDAALVVLDCFRRAMTLASARPVQGSPEALSASTLRMARQRVHINLVRYRTFRDELDSRYWQVQGPSALAALGDLRFHRVGSDPVTLWAATAFAQYPLTINTQPLVDIILDTARTLLLAAPAIRVLIAQADSDSAAPANLRDEVDELRRMLDALAPPVVANATTDALRRQLEILRNPPTATEVTPSTRKGLLRLLATHVLETALAPSERAIEQPVELMQISSDSPNLLGSALMPEDKLAGIQLGHFGAFYKRSWRANDWMWGRLDAAYRLVQILLNPSRLRQRRLPRDLVLQVLERVALGEGPLRKALEEQDSAWAQESIRQELDFLDHPELPVPQDLPACARAVSRRIQLEIVQEELPSIAHSVDYDIKSGAASRASAVMFSKEFERVNEKGRLNPSAALELFRLCRVGRERVVDESHSNRFARTVGDATGITVSAARGARSGLPGPMRVMLSSLRGFALTLWILIRSAVEENQWAAVVTTGLLAVGGAMLAVVILAENPPDVFALLGAALLAGGLLVASIRVGAGWTIVAVLIALLIVFFPFVTEWSLRTFDSPPRTKMLDWLEQHRDDLSQALIVVGLVVGSMTLGLVQRRPATVEDLPISAHRPDSLRLFLSELRETYGIPSWS
jgi:patatin-related protein